MKLTRFKRNSSAILGILKDDAGGTYFVSENPQKAIPSGVYAVAITHSPRFGCDLPIIVNDALGVPSSRGIRIHTGNVALKDSQGCLLVANACDLALSSVSSSKAALAQLLKHCGDRLEIVDL